MDLSDNMTFIATEIHPCFKTDEFHVLTDNPSATCVLFHLFLGSLSVITVCGNLLVIMSIIYFKQLHTPTNALILSLAVADLLVGVIVFPLSMEFSVGVCQFHHNPFCTVRDTLYISLCTASILNLCCISIDRYYAVCQPLTYKTKVTDRVVSVMIFASWGLSVLIVLGFIIIGTIRETCGTECLGNVVIANIFGLIVSFYLPVIIMLCIYLKIFLVAQRQARSIQSTRSGGTASKLERKATRTLATVMGVFLLCWLPFFLCTAVSYDSHVYVPVTLLGILNWLALANSMINPFIYAFFYSWFRSAFRMIISGKIIQGDFTYSKLL